MEANNLSENLRQAIINFEKARDEFFEILLNEIPESNHIKRLNQNCFLINLSDLSKDKILDPKFYDYKYQMDLCISVLTKTPISEFISTIKKMIKDGFIVYAHKEQKLHPVIIKYLKTIL